MNLPYIYRWDRQGRKSQACNVLARGTMNSCLVEFADGYRMVTSRNAIMKNRAADFPTLPSSHARVPPSPRETDSAAVHPRYPGYPQQVTP